MRNIEFWFEFSSPYAYFASLQVDAIAARHGRGVVWQPFLLGAAFQATGMTSLTKTPIRGDYARHDWARLARRLNVPFSLPPTHPALTTAAGRTFYWIEEHAPDLAVPFARSVLAAYFGRGVDVSAEDDIVAIAAGCGADVTALRSALPTQACKDRFRAATNVALARGVFGSPFFFVDGEPFWGADRLPMIDEWLARGGW